MTKNLIIIALVIALIYYYQQSNQSKPLTFEKELKDQKISDLERQLMSLAKKELTGRKEFEKHPSTKFSYKLLKGIAEIKEFKNWLLEKPERKGYINSKIIPKSYYNKMLRKRTWQEFLIDDKKREREKEKLRSEGEKRLDLLKMVEVFEVARMNYFS